MPLPAIAAAIARGAASLAAAAGEAAATVGRGAMGAAQAVGGSLNPVASAIGMGTAAGPAAAGQASTFAAAAANARSAAGSVVQGGGNAAAQVAQGATQAAAAGPVVVNAAQGAAAPAPGWFAQLRQQISQGIAQALAGQGGQGQGPPMPPGTTPGGTTQPPNSGGMSQLFQSATTNVQQLVSSGPSITGLLRSIKTGDKTGDAIKDTILALVELPARLRDFGASVLEARRGLAEYNGQISNAFARLEFERFGRTVRVAAGTSQSTEGLAAAQSRFEEKMLMYQSAGINVMNRGLQAALVTADTLIRIAEFLNPLPAALIKWAAGDDSKANPQALASLAVDIANAKVFKRNMPPSR